MFVGKNDELLFESESDSDELTLEYIIEEKPPTKVVRLFFRENLASIRSEEEMLFSGGD
jgi:hypothetical protein